MNARHVLVPVPTSLPSLVITGPISPCSASSAEGASLSLFDALADAAEDEANASGWCCWWATSPRHAGHVARVDVWLDDDAGGQRSLKAVQRCLEDASFLVQVHGRPSTPQAISRGESPLHARLGTARLGTLAGDVAVPWELRDDLESVQIESAWRWPVQRCRRCGHRGHPVERIAGFPGRETWLAVALGEAVLAGCLVDEGTDFDAECAACGGGFKPRRR